MRTTLDLPDSLFRELKSCAAIQGISLNELIVSFVQAGLQDRIANVGFRPKSALPVARKFTGETIPALTNQQVERILTEEDGGSLNG